MPLSVTIMFVPLMFQRSADDRLPASLLAQTSASLALAYISPILITTYVELIYIILENFKTKLPGQQSSEELSPIIQLFSGLSLGVLLSQLSLESFGDVCGSEVRYLLSYIFFPCMEG